MAYKLRPGVELIQVCGQNILVATRELWREYPRVLPIPPMWGLCWKMMAPDATDKKAIDTMMTLFRKSEDEVRERLNPCLERLHEVGFMLEVPDEDDAHDEG